MLSLLHDFEIFGKLRLKIYCRHADSTTLLCRDEYVAEVRNLLRAKEKEASTRDKRYVSTKRDSALLKFSFMVTATPSLSLEFIKPNFRKNIL